MAYLVQLRLSLRSLVIAKPQIGESFFLIQYEAPRRCITLQLYVSCHYSICFNW
jgi:hypothetical protein